MRPPISIARWRCADSELRNVWAATSQRLGCCPTRSSAPARRAQSRRSTMSRGRLGFPSNPCRFERAIYEADLSTLLDVLGECSPDAHRTMIVGHNPGLEHLLDHLAGGVPVPGDGKLLPTAALARVNLPGDWRRLERGQGELIGLVRVRDLDD